MSDLKLPHDLDPQGGHSRWELRRAFGSSRQAFSFLMLMSVTLLLPEIISQSGLIDRRHSYEIMTENHGAYSFVAREIFDNREDIDVLFLGSSILFSGVDTPKVQQALTAEHGRPVRAVTFGHYFNSIDVLYMQLRDVLSRKRVRMVVLSIPRVPYTDGPSTTGCRFIRYSDVDEIVEQLPLKYQASLYGCGLLRAPRDLLTMIRKNRISPSSFSEGLGMDEAEIGLGRDPRTFSKFSPVSPSIPADDMFYSRNTEHQFKFTGEEIPYYQDLYLKRLIDICRRNGVPVVILNIPQFTEWHSETVVERKNWQVEFGGDLPIIGIRPSVLFAGLSDDELDKLRFDDAHLNANGREYFTRAVLPAILEVYRKNVTKDN